MSDSILPDSACLLTTRFTRRWIIGAAAILCVNCLLGKGDDRDIVRDVLPIFDRVDWKQSSPQVTADCARVIEVMLEITQSFEAQGNMEPAQQIARYFQDVQTRLKQPSQADFATNKVVEVPPALEWSWDDLILFDEPRAPGDGQTVQWTAFDWQI